MNGVFAQMIRLSIKGVAVHDPGTDGIRGHVILGEMEHTLLDFDPLGGRVADRLGRVFTKRNVDLNVPV